MRGFMQLVNQWRMFLEYCCSSKQGSKQAWQKSRYFITLTLHKQDPQHGNVNTEHR